MGFVLGVFVRHMPQRGNPKALATMSCTVFGVLYVPWLLSFITKINYGLGEAASGRFFVLYLVVVTKAADVGAYFVGSAFGKHPLIPRISPKKTWEGLLGGVLMSVWMSILMWGLLNPRIPPELNVRFGVGDAAVLGIGMGLVAIAGDLAESLVKREAGVKDSGRMLPGIGGALDLVDSLLFTAPLLFVYMRLVLR
jgi:phosphatidate cytidylyltransferase